MRPETGSRAAASTLIAIPALAAAYLGSVGSLFLDDLSLWALAHRYPFPTPELLTTSWFGHLMPGGMLAAWLESRAFGLTKWPYGITQGLGLLWVMFLLWRISQFVLGTGRIALLPLALAASSFSLISAASWWANAIWAIPLAVVTLWAVLIMLRSQSEQLARSTYFIVGLLIAGLCFSEKAVLLPFTLYVVDIARRETNLRTAARQTWTAWRRLWLLSLAVLLAYLVVLSQIQQGLTGEVPFESRPSEAWSTALAMWSTGFPAGQLGGPIVWVNVLLAAPPDWFLAFSRTVLLAVTVAAVVACRGSRRMITWTAVTLTGMAAVLASTRFIEFQFLIIQQVRYGADLVPLLCISFMLTLRAYQHRLHAGRTDRLALRRIGMAAATFVAVLAAGSWVTTMNSAARAFTAEAQTPPVQTIKAIADYMSNLPAGVAVLDTPVREAPFGVVATNTAEPLTISEIYGPLVGYDRFVESSSTPLLYDGAGIFSRATPGGHVVRFDKPLCLSPQSPEQSVGLPAPLFPGLHLVRAIAAQPNLATAQVQLDSAPGGSLTWESTASTTWVEGGGDVVHLRLLEEQAVCLTMIEIGPPNRQFTVAAPGAP